MTDDDQPGNGGPKRRKRRRRRKRPPGGQTQESGSQQPTPPPPATGTAKHGGRKPDHEKAAKKKRASRRTPVQREVSSGGVVYRRDGDRIEVVLASRRTRRGDLAWGLAKGGIEEGESFEDAAVREVREETGYQAVIEASLGDTKYFYVWEETRIRKTVHFFLMRCTGGDPGDRDDEMEEVRWFPLERALKRAAYRGEREVLGRAADLLR
jgi:8-oxo-dGTP pyrophosphatase MutT (NUDIX family)